MGVGTDGTALALRCLTTDTGGWARAGSEEVGSGFLPPQLHSAGAKKTGFLEQGSTVSIPALLLTTGLTLDKFLNLFVTHFPSLSNGC